ncbi:cytochrome c [Pseudomonas sp. WS 5011]|uniref:c-type cytochrome n=1 Tax=Pseudomonas sp. WS 5011 TaxID=2717477 RepID=UPI001475841C|nr:cytochrome c [Pseudomonas sp. WS 5011]NMY53268.1 cytochrome c [Pseudomonas sp. WS 5011]
MKRTIKTLVAAGVVGSAALVGGAYLGLVNVGADDPHFPAVHAFLTMARDRSIEVRSKDIEVPNLNDDALIKAGAGNYNSMCIGCHLAPGVAETELSQSLYPAPPNLTKVGIDGNPAAAFWVIKHGIKATGMPAWGKSMGDQYIWGMVAFLDQLPKMDAGQYQALVASSGGHDHGGGETQMHNHEGQHGSAKTDHHAEPEAATDHHASDSSKANAGADHHGDSSSSADHHTADMTPSGSGADHHATDGQTAEEAAGHHETEPAQKEQAPAAAPNTHTHADGKEHLHDS